MNVQCDLLDDYCFLVGSFVSAVNIYKGVLPKSVDPERQADAEKQIAALPLTEIPPLSAIPDGSRMPFKRNTQFIGRQDELRRLAAALKSGETVALCETTTVAESDGLGKSALAAEFAHRYGCFFSGGVFWLSLTHPPAVVAEVIACGGPDGLNLQPEVFSKLPWGARLRLVAAEWQSSLPRLLIFDDCEDEELLAQWCPSIGGSRVLVTSRRREWRENLNLKIISLCPLLREESIALLRIERSDLSADSCELNAIASELADCPFALRLAGSYLEWSRNTEYGYPNRP